MYLVLVKSSWIWGGHLHRVADFFYEEPDSKYFRFCEFIWLLLQVSNSHCSKKAAIGHMETVWLCFSKTLFTKMGCKLNLDYRLLVSMSDIGECCTIFFNFFCLILINVKYNKMLIQNCRNIVLQIIYETELLLLLDCSRSLSAGLRLSRFLY